MVSYVIKGHPPEVRQRLATLPIGDVVVSAVTQAELFYGLARKGHPATLARLIKEFLFRVQVLCHGTALLRRAYGDLRASCTASGIVLGVLDMMIAAHAIATKSTLVTHDKAYRLVPGDVLVLEDWIGASGN